MKKHSGFTLIELIIAVAIVGIMAAIAVPNFGSLMSNSRLKSTYNSFAGTLATARAEAVTRRTTITVCPSADGASCLTNGDSPWTSGYIAFTDIDVDSVVDSATGETVLKHETIPNGIVVRSANGSTAINMAPKGRLRDPDTYIFCQGDNDNTAKALNLSITGLGRFATDEDEDGIVEGIDQVNVSCTDN